MGKCEKSVNYVYDVIAALISLSDIITDVVVTYQFYQNDRMIFFGLSLTFIILAQLSYVFAFIIEIGDEDNPFTVLLLFCCLLPISPILSFVFYLTAGGPDTFVSKLLTNHFCFDVSIDSYAPDLTKNKLKQWMQAKLRKHIGFIMEALIEAFPQSIIQLSAIIIYNEPNMISIISILISMISVSSKTFILSIQFSMNIKTLLFNWFCAVTDFIGVFCAVSWVFYKSHHPTVATIALLWQMKLIICVIPVVFCISIALYIVGMKEFTSSLNSNSTSTVTALFSYFGIWLVVTILWAFGMLLGTLGLEISTFLWIVFPICLIGTERIPSNNKLNKIWLNILSWINDNSSHTFDGILSITAKQDKIIRLCCVNKMIIEKSDKYKLARWDKKLVEFINENAKTSFMNIKSLKELRLAHGKVNLDEGPSPEFIETLVCLLMLPFVFARGDYNDCNNPQLKRMKKITLIAIGFANFFIAPFYYLSRIFNVLFPFIILINLFIVNGYQITNIFIGIDTFQIVILLLYLLFISIIFVIGYFVLKEQYNLWHIMPSKIGDFGSLEMDKQLVLIKYDKIITIPIRDALLKRKYGVDIATIIIEYCNHIQD